MKELEIRKLIKKSKKEIKQLDNELKSRKIISDKDKNHGWVFEYSQGNRIVNQQVSSYYTSYTSYQAAYPTMAIRNEKRYPIQKIRQVENRSIYLGKKINF